MINKYNLEIRGHLGHLFTKATGGGIPFDPFWVYLETLIKWNSKINLTSIRDPEGILEGHFLDSLQLLPYVPDRSTLLDIGSGAGFPGIPLKIALPHIRLTVVESIKKKASFLKEITRILRLTDVEVINQRLPKSMKIGSFNRIVSRGTMELKELIDLATQNLAPDGLILMLKGQDPYPEIEDAKAVCQRLQTKVDVKEYTLPISKRRRTVVVVSNLK